MPDTSTPLLQLVDQTNGGNDDTWGDIADANFLKLETAIAGAIVILVSGGTVTLTDDQVRPMRLQIAGTLTSDAVVVVPARHKLWLVQNITSGGFSVTVKTLAGAGYMVPQQRSLMLFCDSVGVYPVQSAGTEIGAIVDYATTSAPAGWLVCDGSAVSRTTYAQLFAAVGTTWGIGDGSTTFNLPNQQAKYRRGADGSFAVGASVTQDVQSHSHTASASTDSQGGHDHGGSLTAASAGAHTHLYDKVTSGGSTVPSGAPGPITQWTTTPTATDSQGAHTHSVSVPTAGAHTHTVSVTVNASSGSETRPNSIAVLPCIRYQ